MNNTLDLLKAFQMNKANIEELEKANENILKILQEEGFKTHQTDETKFTLTPSKPKLVIDYETTLEGVNELDYKKDRISKVWNDEKILETFKDNIKYIDKPTKARLTITKRK